MLRAIKLLLLVGLVAPFGYCELVADNSNATSSDIASGQSHRNTIPAPAIGSKVGVGNHSPANSDEAEMAGADAQTSKDINVQDSVADNAKRVSGNVVSTAEVENAVSGNKTEKVAGAVDLVEKVLAASTGKQVGSAAVKKDGTKAKPGQTATELIPDKNASAAVSNSKDKAATTESLKDKGSDPDTEPTQLPPPPATVPGTSKTQHSDDGLSKKTQISEMDDGNPEVGDGAPGKPPSKPNGADLGVEVDDDDDAGDGAPPKQPAQGLKPPGVPTKVDAKVPAVSKDQYHPKLRYDDEPESSHFLAYLLTIGVLCAAAYLVAHNRHKIMGLILEGRNGRRTHRSGSIGSRGVKYKRLQHDDVEAETGEQLSSRDGGRVIY